MHVEKREIRVVDDKEHNINTGNSTDFADEYISDKAAYELIATAVNACVLTDCADILISNDSADGLIAIAIDAGN